LTSLNQGSQGGFGLLGVPIAVAVRSHQVTHSDGASTVLDELDQTATVLFLFRLTQHHVNTGHLMGEPACDLDAGAGAGLADVAKAIGARSSVGNDVMKEHEPRCAGFNLGER